MKKNTIDDLKNIDIKKVDKTMIENFSKYIGLPISDWQVDIVYKTFTEGRVFLSAPRRCGKTQISLLIMIMAAMLGRSVIFLIHSKDGARDVMTRVVKYCKILENNGYIEKILKSNGFHEIYFKNGGRILFRVRGEGVAVSMAFDTVIWDESQKIKQSTVEEVTPVLQEFNHPIELFIGTPPTEKDFELYGVGNPFIDEKKKSLNEKNTSFIEYSSYDSYDPDRKFTYHDARRANPSWKRMPDFWKRLKEVQTTMSHESFARQYLGVWNFPESYDKKEPYLTSSDLDGVFTNNGSKSQSFIAGVGIIPHSSECYIIFSDGVIFELVSIFSVEWNDFSDVVDFLYERRRILKKIVLPKNSLGQLLNNKLLEKKIAKNKINLITITELNSLSYTFLKQLKSKELKIFNNDTVSIALSSFTLEYSDKWGVNEVKSTIPEDLALLYGFFNAVSSDPFDVRVEKKKEAERASGVNSYNRVNTVDSNKRFYGSKPFTIC